MTSADPPQDIWSRLHDYCQHGHVLKYPPLTDEQARDLERHGIFLPPEERDHYMSIGNGIMMRPQLTCYPPATEEQLHATEEQLGFSLPPDLRHFYAEVANGGVDFDGCVHLYGAIGGCGLNAPHRIDGPTIGELAHGSDWQLHTRIEEALLRHRDRYVIVDSVPKGFLLIGDSGSEGIVTNWLTGCVYCLNYWDDLPDVIVNYPPYSSFEMQVQYMQVIAPSLRAWFASWLDEAQDPWLSGHQPLAAEMVEADDLPDPDVVWRGLYRFGPNWHVWEQPPEDTNLAHDAEHAIYWTYVEDAERRPNRW